MSAAKFQIAPGFAVPFVLCEHPSPAALNERLRRLFLERETAGERYANPQPLVQRNAALWESNFQLFDWPDAPVTELRDYCWGQLYRAIRELNGYDLEQLRKLHVSAESWFHITRKGGYFALHNHPMASWSGLAVPRTTAQRTAAAPPPPACGAASSPRTRAPMVMFPSWVLHEVRPYLGAGERITVAFNARFKMVGIEQGQMPIYRA
ncbi:MAG: hypothetical protein IPO66_00115 [Rhodanobacteraceae bacterium]|nr:hypothetical protein [Rhodanobacteraceae bacterium]